MGVEDHSYLSWDPVRLPSTSGEKGERGSSVHALVGGQVWMPSTHH